MKLLILSCSLLFCSGCWTHMVCHQFSKCSAEYPVDKMSVLEGGITGNDSFVINKMCHEKNYTFTVNDKKFSQALIKAEGDKYTMTTEIDEKIVRSIPIYSKTETPAYSKEYLKIISKNEDLLKMEYRDGIGQTKTIEVDISYTKDPYFVKRSGLLLVLPVALSVDCILTIFGQGGYPLHAEDIKDKAARFN